MTGEEPTPKDRKILLSSTLSLLLHVSLQTLNFVLLYVLNLSSPYTTTISEITSYSLACPLSNEL